MSKENNERFEEFFSGMTATQRIDTMSKIRVSVSPETAVLIQAPAGGPQLWFTVNLKDDLDGIISWSIGPDGQIREVLGVSTDNSIMEPVDMTKIDQAYVVYQSMAYARYTELQQRASRTKIVDPNAN